MGFSRADLDAMSLSEAATWLRLEEERRAAKAHAIKRQMRKAKGAMPVVPIGGDL